MDKGQLQRVQGTYKGYKLDTGYVQGIHGGYESPTWYEAPARGTRQFEAPTMEVSYNVK